MVVIMSENKFSAIYANECVDFIGFEKLLIEPMFSHNALMQMTQTLNKIRHTLDASIDEIILYIQRLIGLRHIINANRQIKSTQRMRFAFAKYACNCINFEIINRVIELAHRFILVTLEVEKRLPISEPKKTQREPLAQQARIIIGFTNYCVDVILPAWKRDKGTFRKHAIDNLLLLKQYCRAYCLWVLGCLNQHSSEEYQPTQNTSDGQLQLKSANFFYNCYIILKDLPSTLKLELEAPYDIEPLQNLCSGKDIDLMAEGMVISTELATDVNNKHNEIQQEIEDDSSQQQQDGEHKREIDIRDIELRKRLPALLGIQDGTSKLNWPQNARVQWLISTGRYYETIHEYGTSLAFFKVAAFDGAKIENLMQKHKRNQIAHSQPVPKTLIGPPIDNALVIQRGYFTRGEDVDSQKLRVLVLVELPLDPEVPLQHIS